VIDENLGKILVVNSWASWCPACADELPDLATLGEEFSDKNVKVLAINRAEPKSTATVFLASINATDGLQLVLDPGDKFYASVGGFAMPETIFYDPQGNVILHVRGQMTYQEMRAQTELMVNQSTDK
jgi:cytochrome c biogenesis protein CcmG/thiol:disulfide interchange protein DsbE